MYKTNKVLNNIKDSAKALKILLETRESNKAKEVEEAQEWLKNLTNEELIDYGKKAKLLEELYEKSLAEILDEEADSRAREVFKELEASEN